MTIAKRLILVVSLFMTALVTLGAYGLYSLVEANSRSEYIASVTLPGITDSRNRRGTDVRPPDPHAVFVDFRRAGQGKVQGDDDRNVKEDWRTAR